MTPVGIIDARGLFPELSRLLLELLEGLSPEEWQRPTVCTGWTVKDVAAHLLDSSLRRLSFERDRFVPPPPAEPIESYAGLVQFLNRLNADWITATRRLSPAVLTALLRTTLSEFQEHVAALNPQGPALFSVAWAGEQESRSWFDVARELTEHWHHQQQIRDAVEAPPLLDRRFLYPVLDTFLRALPHAYRDAAATAGTAIHIQITGNAGGDWSLLREAEQWSLYHGAASTPATTIRMDQDTAWRLFTKAIAPADAAVAIEGELAGPLLAMVSVMAVRS